jgi:pimeloyl-ACP methyl ester carboxylesterase
MMPGERSVFQINAETAARLKAERSATWAMLDPAGKREAIRRAIGDERSPDKAILETVGELKRGDLVIRKRVLRSEIPLPGLSFHPAKPDGRVVVYLHGGSMKADAGPGGPIESLARGGAVVHALELRGIGETETGNRRRAFGAGRFGRDTLEILTAYLVGKSYTGMRTADLESWIEALGAEKVEVIALGEAALPALHAAALNPEAFSSVTLRGMIPSWEALVAAPETHDQLVNLVHGVLRHYDLPDLIGLAGEGKVKLEGSVDGMGRSVE